MGLRNKHTEMVGASEQHRETSSVPGLDGVRIAHVTSVPFFLVTQLKGQMQHLYEQGMRVTMITSQGDELRQLARKTGFEHVVIEIRRKPAPWRDFLALVQMVRLFRTRNFHIIHSTTPKAGLLTALAGWIARVPVRLHTFTGQPWATMKGALRSASRLSDRAICLFNTHVYADSPSQRQFLIDEGIAHADHISVIGAGSLAGVDMKRFCQSRFSDAERSRVKADLGISPSLPVIAFIGRITRDKGTQELLQALYLLEQEGVEVELVLIGPSDTDLEAGHASGRGQLGSGTNGKSKIHRVGYTDVPERYLSITDVLCLPSYREGFGTVVIEAAAMGVPVVGTDITGLSDAVINEMTGVLVPPRDAVALAAALRRLIIDRHLRQRLGKQARQRCLEQFDSEIVNRRLVDEYVRLLSRLSRGAA